MTFAGFLAGLDTAGAPLDTAGAFCFAGAGLGAADQESQWTTNERHALAGEPRKHPVRSLDGVAQGGRSPMYAQGHTHTTP